jgi:hypothetical protein
LRHFHAKALQTLFGEILSDSSHPLILSWAFLVGGEAALGA